MSIPNLPPILYELRDMVDKYTLDGVVACLVQIAKEKQDGLHEDDPRAESWRNAEVALVVAAEALRSSGRS